MAYYRQCPTCGANLDPGETCEECSGKKDEKQEANPIRSVTPARITAMTRENRHLKAAVGWEYN